jgi:hypothetical protein
VDERFDRVDERFDRVDERFEPINVKFEGLHQLAIKIGGGLIGTLIVALVTVLATH